MATKLELEITLDSKGAVAGVKSLDKELTGLSKTTQTATTTGKGLMGSIFGQVTAANLATQAVGKLTAFVQESAQAYMEAEKQQARMNVVLRRSGEDVDKANESISAFADKMEYLTGVDDDQVKTLEILARQYNIQKDRIDEAVKSSLALTEIGGDLEGNLKAVANAYNGNWRQLGALIPEIKSANTESERMDILQRAVATGFEMSTAAMQTNAGKLQELKNFWDDLKKAAGGVLVTALQGIDAISGMHSKMAAVARDQITQIEAFDQALRNFEARSGAKLKSYGAPSLGVQGFNDIESDLATGYLADTSAALKFQEALDKLEETKKKHKEETEKHVETLEERWKAVQANIEKDREWQAYLNGMFPAVESYSDAWAENVDITNMAQEAMDELQPTMDGLAKAILKESEQTKKWSIDWQDANEVIQFAQSLAGGLTDLLGALDVELGESGDAAIQAASGIGQLWAGIQSFNPISIIQGATQAISGLIKLFKGDGVGEAIERENSWMQLTKQQVEQLRQLEAQYDDTHAATSELLDQFISSANITTDNFDQWAHRLHEIVIDFDRGTLSLQQTQQQMGDAFTALIAKAEELGTSGSSSLLTLFDELKGRGLEVAEITEYINQQMTAGLTGYKAYLEGDFSDATIGVFEGMLAYEKKVGENRGLIDGVQGITDALVGMSNATRLTEEEFDNFEMAARDAFDALRKKGFTEKESLTEMAPMLSRMIFLHNEYGLAIDAETQALIDKAKAEGVNLDKYKSQEEIFSDMDSSLRELVDIFKNGFPNAINATTTAFRGLNDESSKFNPNINDADYSLGGKKPKKPTVHAAGGFYSPRLSRDTVIQAHRGEEVIITPQREVGGGGQRVTNINITLAGSITPETAADAIMRAYRSNTRGLRSLLEN